MLNLETSLSPCGDQPEAIEQISSGILNNTYAQVLLGITGSGKTFTMANILSKVQKPALILAHNKTLAAQLYQEFKTFFPKNAVEYFVSYYDYYQPEAYIPRTDTYIEKDLAINDRIDQMRLSATRSLIERRDVIIVSSVSCIYGLGLPEHYAQMVLSLKIGQKYRRNDLLIKLVELHYTRSDFELARGSFRVRGDIIDIVPAYQENLAYRIEIFGDEIERIREIDPLTLKAHHDLTFLSIFPASHYVTPESVRFSAVESILAELEIRRKEFLQQNKLIEEERIRQRTLYDVEMIREMGFCKGIENYSRHFSQRKPGEPAPCLLDYFPKDFLVFIDESHQTVPQLHAMYNGDRARKQMLVDYGFRLPSAYDNRPLKFEEVFQKIPQVVFVSATPGAWEIEQSKGVIIEQIIRPTYLLDPPITVLPIENQVEDVLDRIRKEVEKKGKILVSTLTKKLAEELSKYLMELNIRAKYLHSEIDTLERIEIINGLRKDQFDVLVGVNLLREGLDIPEVSLVAILDADKEGFLRNETSLIQTCGRAARHPEGHVLMYAEKTTKAIQKTLDETDRRRKIQEKYNRTHHLVPRPAQRKAIESLEKTFGITESFLEKEDVKQLYKNFSDIEDRIRECKAKMKIAAEKYQFEEAARLRDEIKLLENLEMTKD